MCINRPKKQNKKVYIVFFSRVFHLNLSLVEKNKKRQVENYILSSTCCIKKVILTKKFVSARTKKLKLHFNLPLGVGDEC